MKKLQFVLALTLLIALYPTSSEAQRRGIGYVSVGAQVNALNYFGDLNPLTQYVSTDLGSIRPGFGMHVTRKLSPRFHARFGFTWGRMTGDDSKAADPNDERHRYRYMRNAHFRNDIMELSVVGILELKASNRIYYRRKHSPYIFAGIAAIYHNPKAKTPESYGGKWTALRPLGTEGQFAANRVEQGYDKPYGLIQPVIPLGAGIRLKLNDKWDLSIETGFRLTFTDYLDDVSGNYANPNDLDAFTRAMANRSLEEVSAFTGQSRADNLAMLTSEVNGVVTVVLDDGTVYSSIAGYGLNANDKRGEKNNEDIYFVTGIHLSYIVEKGLRCPKFGKRRR